MSSIGVVVNPQAGRNRQAGDRAARLGHLLGPQGWVRETASLEQLADAAAECRQRAVEVVGVCGGDGTLARTITALVRAYGPDAALPTILPLRAGTMNTVARAMGCSAWQPERMLAEIVGERRRGEPLPLTEHRLVCINGRHYGFMVGAGVPVEFLRVYYAQPRRGALGALRTLIQLSSSALIGGRTIRRVFRPLPAQLRTDGHPGPFDAYTVVYASTIEDIGLGFRPTYRAREQAGRFHVFAAVIGARAFIARLPAIRLARPIRSRQVYDVLAADLRVEFRDPTLYMIDGDIMEPTTRLDVRLGPVVRVVRR
jgi:diacylglycerol kinase family enzyme